jgi:glucokinase
MHYLGIEIGGTKLQIGLGRDTGTLDALWRGRVEPAEGADGIRRQLQEAVPQLLRDAGITSTALRGVGIGFGGPVNDRTKTILKSHQIEGWEDFPLADWIGDLVGVPAVLGNDADCGGLGEALHGAGKGLSPIFYITIGSGIGGGLIIDGKIYRGTGKGAAEIGHLKLLQPEDSKWVANHDQLSLDMGTLENVASGWALERRIRATARRLPTESQRLLELADGDPDTITLRHVAQAASEGVGLAQQLLDLLVVALASALNRVIPLLCPRRVVIGGGVGLLGEELLFVPLRQAIQNPPSSRAGPWEPPFEPFLGETDIVPAALGEEMVVHGAIALARQHLG